MLTPYSMVLPLSIMTLFKIFNDMKCKVRKNNLGGETPEDF